ncbi:unnamed protein product, partial [Heterotrigona itama]
MPVLEEFWSGFVSYATEFLCRRESGKGGKTGNEGGLGGGGCFSFTLSNVPLVLSPDVGDNSDEKKRSASTPGCLDAITLDLMWITAYIVGLCFIAIFVDVL